MIDIRLTEVFGLEAAIRGMRNPMNSWAKSDSHKSLDSLAHDDSLYVVGSSDLELMKKLAKGGSVHAKYRRMITVYCDINAPLYWWKEFDTYKVGTVANSCSTMHKIHEHEFRLSDFSKEHLNAFTRDILNSIVIPALNDYRHLYNDWETIDGNTKNAYRVHERKDCWWQMIQLLPSSYNQKRTIMMNYEVLAHIYHDRKNHKLDEWHTFCNRIKNLPYSEIITLEEEDDV